MALYCFKSRYGPLLHPKYLIPNKLITLLLSRVNIFQSDQKIYCIIAAKKVSLNHAEQYNFFSVSFISNQD